MRVDSAFGSHKCLALLSRGQNHESSLARHLKRYSNQLLPPSLHSFTMSPMTLAAAFTLALASFAQAAQYNVTVGGGALKFTPEYVVCTDSSLLHEQSS